MLTLAYDARSNVLHVKMRGPLTMVAIDELNRQTRAFAETWGRAHGILDFSEVDRVELSTEAIIKLAGQRPIMTDMKAVYVAPADHTFGVSRMVAGYRRALQGSGPTVAKTLEEALALLGVKNPEFTEVILADGPRTARAKGT